mgnify:CR=1 FL=1
MTAQAGQVEEGVGAALALLLALSGEGDLAGDGGAVGAVVGGGSKGGGFAGDGEVQVDTVEQGPGQFVAIALDQFAAAAAAPGGIAEIAAGAGVHGSHQLETRREAHPVPGPGDDNLAGFQRFAKYLQYPAFKLGKFIEKKHTVMRQGYFAGCRA